MRCAAHLFPYYARDSRRQYNFSGTDVKRLEPDRIVLLSCCFSPAFFFCFRFTCRLAEAPPWRHTNVETTDTIFKSERVPILSERLDRYKLEHAMRHK